MKASFDQRTDALPTEPVILDLPWPVSVNCMYSGAGARRMISAPYRAWKMQAGHILNLQRPYRIDGPYSAVFILQDHQDGKCRDLANFWKGVSDLLVTHGVVRDDSLERQIVMQWSVNVSGCRVVLDHAAKEDQADTLMFLIRAAERGCTGQSRKDASEVR